MKAVWSALWPCAVAVAQNVIPVGYRVETIAIPDGIVLEVGGMAFERDDSLLVCTRIGEVWRYRRGRWSLYAAGLHEPLGLWVDGARGDVYVLQRPELTRLVDVDGDGDADRFLTVSSGWGISDNYHEYAYGLARTPDGSFWGTLNLAHAIAPRYEVGQFGGSTMSRPARWRGWAFRITPQGGFEPIASGLRSPAGIGANAAGEVFYTDNQGDWIGTSTLQHLERGAFYGHPSSLLDHPDFKDRAPDSVPRSELAARRRMPTVHIPYGDLANSPGEPVFDETGGKFGPFSGQAFIGDQTRSNVFRVDLERVDGAYQGCCVNFVDHLQSGVVRGVFASDGSLWVGQTARGWGSAGPAQFGVQRIVFERGATPREILAVRLRRDGFRIEFTAPIDKDVLADVSRYRVSYWHYLYRPEYGSPPQDVTEVVPVSARPASDGASVELSMPELMPQKVYRIVVDESFGVTSRTAWYTLNRLPR